jgi:hypothetical protein
MAMPGGRGRRPGASFEKNLAGTLFYPWLEAWAKDITACVFVKARGLKHRVAA